MGLKKAARAMRAAQKNLRKAMQNGLTQVRQQSSCSDGSCAGISPTSFENCISRAVFIVLMDWYSYHPKVRFERHLEFLIQLLPERPYMLGAIPHG